MITSYKHMVNRCLTVVLVHLLNQPHKVLHHVRSHFDATSVHNFELQTLCGVLPSAIGMCNDYSYEYIQRCDV